MSRTYKDKKPKHRNDYYRYDHDSVSEIHKCVRVLADGSLHKYNHYVRMDTKTTKPKRRRTHLDYNYLWLQATPSWWTRLTMNRPQRRAGRVWEATVNRLVDIEEVDAPGVSKRPHIYFW